MPQPDGFYFLFALFIGFFFSILASFAFAQSERIEEAWFSDQRKKIKQKWNYVLRPRSQCALCKKNLPALFLIPLAGNFIARMLCTQCREKLSHVYFFQELGAFLYGFFFALGVFHQGQYIYNNSILPTIFLEAIFVLIFFHAARIDKKYMLVADSSLVSLLIVALLKLFLLNEEQDILINFLWALLWFVLLWLLQKIFSHQLGLADVRLIPILILATGVPLGMFLPLLASSAAIVWAWQKRKNSPAHLHWTQKKIPFVPFLFFAWLCLSLISFWV